MWAALLAGAPVLVDMVVAEIDGASITRSELAAETRLVLLRTRGVEVAQTAEATPDLERAVLRSMVHRALVLAEVERLHRSVPEDEVARALGQVRRVFASPEDFDRFMIGAGFRDPVSGDLSLLESVVRSELRVARYLEAKVRVTTDERELERCYQANVDRFFGRSFAEMKPRIALALGEQKKHAAVRELITSLEGRAKIRYAPGFEPGALPDRADGMGLRCPE
jgi:hypothetical protein